MNLPRSSPLAAMTLVIACSAVAPPPEPAKPQPPSPAMSQATTPPAKNAAAAPARPAATPAKPAATAAKSAPAPKAPLAVAAAAPPIDLKSLEQKLKDSKAIGVMTKLSLKNQVDDLVAQFKAYHDGHQPPTLAQLRQPYELLLMKVLSLVQDQDPALAKALHDSRDSIWSVLADRDKFLANV